MDRIPLRLKDKNEENERGESEIFVCILFYSHNFSHYLIIGKSKANKPH